MCTHICTGRVCVDQGGWLGKTKRKDHDCELSVGVVKLTPDKGTAWEYGVLNSPNDTLTTVPGDQLPLVIVISSPGWPTDGLISMKRFTEPGGNCGVPVVCGVMVAVGVGVPGVVSGVLVVAVPLGVPVVATGLAVDEDVGAVVSVAAGVVAAEFGVALGRPVGVAAGVAVGGTPGVATGPGVAVGETAAIWPGGGVDNRLQLAAMRAGPATSRCSTTT